MNHNPFACLAVLLREDQTIGLVETEEEPAFILAAQLVIAHAMQAPQVSQILRRLDVADAPAEEFNRLDWVLGGSLVLRIELLEFLVREDELQGSTHNLKDTNLACILAITLWVKT